MAQMPQRPIQPRSAHYFHAEAERPALQILHSSNVLVQRAIVDGWAYVTMYRPQILADYVHMEQNDKVRYEAEMMQYEIDLAAYHGAQMNNG